MRQIRAVFDRDTITVYQAYPPAIAAAAVAAGKFVAPMYRCGWATKPGQERVLAIRLARSGFEEALSLASLSHFDPAVYENREGWSQRKSASAVRVQWDPERDANLEPLPGGRSRSDSAGGRWIAMSMSGSWS